MLHSTDFMGAILTRVAEPGDVIGGLPRRHSFENSYRSHEPAADIHPVRIGMTVQTA